MPAGHTDYLELRCRSAFSFLAGGSSPEDLVTQAGRHEYPALALADLDGLYGAPRLWKAARAEGIRPIVGADVALPAGRLLLLVETSLGYRNLCKLLTRAHARGPKGSPSVTLEEIEEHAHGLLCLAGAGESPLAHALQRRDVISARALADRLRSLFADRLWIDIQRSLDPRIERRSRALSVLAEQMGLPLVATGDVRTATAEEGPVLDVLACIRKKATLETMGRRLAANHERYLASPGEMGARFRDLPRAVMATRAIAERCDFSLERLGYRFPEFPVPPGETSLGRLTLLAFQGASERYGDPLSLRVRAQIEHELRVIGKLELAGYFLIVWDIVRFCRERGILVQGRGSAANSAVCYALGITAVDAVGMDLLFERFLSEERGEWPDVDLDLPSGDRREEVIQYVYRRYGPPHDGIARSPREMRTVGSGVAMTANVITYRAKSAMREAGKALGLAPMQLDRLSKLLAHHGFQEDREGLSERFRDAGIDVDAPRIRLLLHCVEAMQGIPRHLGQHSGGMVIAAGRLDEVVPLEPATMPGRAVIQWDKDDCADLGLIKIDLLGLGMMAALEEAIPLIRESEGVEIDLARLPQNDPATFAAIRRADTIGVFQIESRAQMATLPRLQPKNFYDLVVEVAIIRPGPIVGQMVHPYLNRRAGREEVGYADPRLEPILGRTLGVPLFQEQLLRMAMVVAGFSAGEAEELRRAMAFKRSVQRMKQIEHKLWSGLEANGIRGEPARQIIRSISSFALYGFPESHAASFALLAYASAYLKTHHPEAFLCALLNAWPMGFYHPATLVKDAQRHGVRVMPIDVCRSEWRSTLESLPEGEEKSEGRPVVRLGLRFVRELREETVGRLCRARREAPLRDISDLMLRVDLSRREVSALAELGALAPLGNSCRREALWQVLAMAPAHERLLAGTSQPHAKTLPPRMSPLEETLADYRFSGITTGPHVMAHLRGELDDRGVVRVADLATLADGMHSTTAGLVIVRQRPGTAKGFCFLTLEDETGTGNAVLTPPRYTALRGILNTTNLLLLSGRIQRRDGVTHLKVEDLSPLAREIATPPSHDFR